MTLVVREASSSRCLRVKIERQACSSQDARLTYVFVEYRPAGGRKGGEGLRSALRLEDMGWHVVCHAREQLVRLR